MTGPTPLAHSPRGDTSAQEYVSHVREVRRRAITNARRATAFYAGNGRLFVDWVDAAALYHDLGKLDPENQAVLRDRQGKPLRIPHEDAGVAQLENMARLESAVLVAAHHAGLFSKADEVAKQGRPFRRPEIAAYVDAQLAGYVALHAATGCQTANAIDGEELHNCGFTRRVALSCLVDADHGDTSRHYGAEADYPKVRRRWRERMEALHSYVHRLPEGRSELERERNQLRRTVYDACCNAEIGAPIRTCDAPVGSGKTTAVMAHLLRAALAKRLRHILVVLPYTNIISQAVGVYRKALVLEGERAEDVVAEHHHRADFADGELRQFAGLWKAPVIVTTAVQFFETLASHHPARLRKMHELPGSAVFVDETHAAIPSHLWPQMWRWMEVWTREWGGYLVLGSGSLPRFWELREYREAITDDPGQSVALAPDLISEHSLREKLHKQEKRRVVYRRRENQQALDLSGLIGFVSEKRGPRLLIVNTVQSAAVVAEAMRQAGHDVLHLSTALAPVHRDVLIDRIRCRLRERIEDWTLVATSCVEAGLDFSFCTGFRERSSTASLIQIGGRVNRSGEYNGSEVWDLLLHDDCFSENPSLTVSRQALDRFSENELNSFDPSDIATRAMRREWTSGSELRARQIVQLERDMEYPQVALRCRVIEADTRTVIIDPILAESVRKRRRISRTELSRYSVQLWATKVDLLGLESLLLPERAREAMIYAWCDETGYEPDFLGYMAGVLRNQRFMSDPEACVI